jgi:hypothetical protein
MNPIKHLYNEVDRHFQLHEDLPTSKDKLRKKKLHEDWNNTEVEIPHKLVKSMPNMVQASLKAREAYTKN